MAVSINRVSKTRSNEIVWGCAMTATGAALVATNRGSICRVDLRTGSQALLALRMDWPDASMVRDDTGVQHALDFAMSALERDAHHDVQLTVKGTEFQTRVWRALQAIPAGETRTYGELAAAIGQPRAARAVGSAAAANTIALLIPCHRLVPAAGGTGAFRWGAALKGRLLLAERDFLPYMGKNEQISA